MDLKESCGLLSIGLHEDQFRLLWKCNEPLASIKYVEFLHYLNKYWLFLKDCCIISVSECYELYDSQLLNNIQDKSNCQGENPLNVYQLQNQIQYITQLCPKVDKIQYLLCRWI